MKIDKAIEILDTLLDDYNEEPNPDETDAVKLGIEALKRVKKMRTFKPTPPGMPLPGETP